jgi:hypothetical protein
VSTQPTVQREPRSHLPEVRGPGRETAYAPPFNSHVKTVVLLKSDAFTACAETNLSYSKLDKYGPLSVLSRNDVIISDRF